jgi:UDP-3-O-[3-hydroxymyristoyl] glucosamine N-acyltransferase
MQNNIRKYTLTELTDILKAELRGDGSYVIDSIAPITTAEKNQISFVDQGVYAKYLATTNAGAVILTKENAGAFSGNAVIMSNPYVGYAKISKLFADIPTPNVGIHKGAVLGTNCEIDPTAKIANSTLGNNVKIGKNTAIEAGVVIGDYVTIGDNCHIFPNVTIYYNSVIGNNVIIHGGAVIGADGFGMANENGVWNKIYQLGRVQILDDVEIGANTCIDRGALADTIIENGVKLDNLIQIGHNVKIGANTAIAGCTAVAGSTKIGRNCTIGGACTINGHIEIADQVVVTGDSTVGRSIESKGVYSSGLTVLPHRAWLKIIMQLVQLDKLFNRVHKLEEKLHGDNEHK